MFFSKNSRPAGSIFGSGASAAERPATETRARSRRLTDKDDMVVLRGWATGGIPLVLNTPLRLKCFNQFMRTFYPKNEEADPP